MGMEVAGSDVPQVNGDAKPGLHDKENGKVDASEPITFGSHGVDEQQAKGEAKSVVNANVPKDAVDEWPEAPQIHSFWCVKYRQYEDPTLKAKMETVDREIQKTNQRISQIIEQLKPKRAAKSELGEELRSLSAESSQYSAVMNEKRQVMRPLQDALGTLRGSGRGFGICSTEEELNDLIRGLEYRIQHESIPLKEEKQLLREIKELEATRPKVIANTASRAKIQDSFGQTDVIQDQVKSLGTDLDGVRKQKAALKARMDHLGQQVKAFEAQIKPLQEEFEVLNKKRDDLYKSIKELRKSRDEGNESYYQNRNVLNRARVLAAEKDLKGLEDLVHEEAEKFMSHWNSSKAFRNDYEKRILMSLDMRQLSRDGRIRNPDEKPLVKVETPRAPQTEVGPKAVNKPQKEEPKPSAKAENLPAQKVQNESKKNIKESKIAPEKATEEEEVFVVGKPKIDVPKIDEAKLKEKKREEEMEKQRQALERKKKLQEKAAAKAALRAQKEAEKKQKDREKKLKKKDSTSAPPTSEEEPTEKEAEAGEQDRSEDVEDVVEASAAPSKAKGGQKENALRYRKNVKTRGTLPKAILKKKKSNNYWLWGSAAAAAVVVLILLALGYTYLL